MNALDLLKEDHEKALDMMRELAAQQPEAGGAADDGGLFKRLYHALVTHAAIEEEIFYPSLEIFSATSVLIPAAFAAHREVQDLLENMVALTPGTDEFLIHLAQLREHLEDHIKQEEEQLFPHAMALLGETLLIEMGQQIVLRRQIADEAAAEQATNRA